MMPKYFILERSGELSFKRELKEIARSLVYRTGLLGLLLFPLENYKYEGNIQPRFYDVCSRECLSMRHQGEIGQYRNTYRSCERAAFNLFLHREAQDSLPWRRCSHQASLLVQQACSYQQCCLIQLVMCSTRFRASGTSSAGYWIICHKYKSTILWYLNHSMPAGEGEWQEWVGSCPSPRVLCPWDSQHHAILDALPLHCLLP